MTPEWPRTVCGTRLWSATEGWQLVSAGAVFGMVGALLAIGAAVFGVLRLRAAVRERDLIEGLFGVVALLVGVPLGGLLAWVALDLAICTAGQLS